jgi:hypothetical protein
MEFKKLEIEPEGSWLKRTLESKHTKKTLIYIVLGAVAGLVYFYFSEGKQIANITGGEIFKSMLVGGFLGFFITNSPCSRGKC